MDWIWVIVLFLWSCGSAARREACRVLMSRQPRRHSAAGAGGPGVYVRLIDSSARDGHLCTVSGRGAVRAAQGIRVCAGGGLVRRPARSGTGGRAGEDSPAAGRQGQHRAPPPGPGSPGGFSAASRTSSPAKSAAGASAPWCACASTGAPVDAAGPWPAQAWPSRQVTATPAASRHRTRTAGMLRRNLSSRSILRLRPIRQVMILPDLPLRTAQRLDTAPASPMGHRAASGSRFNLDCPPVRLLPCSRVLTNTPRGYKLASLEHADGPKTRWPARKESTA